MCIQMHLLYSIQSINHHIDIIVLSSAFGQGVGPHNLYMLTDIVSHFPIIIHWYNCVVVCYCPLYLSSLYAYAIRYCIAFSYNKIVNEPPHIQKKLDTCHVVSNCYGTPNPKFHFEMLRAAKFTELAARFFILRFLIMVFFCFKFL